MENRLNILNIKIDIYQIDAFTNKLFSGNPAAVCPLDEWIDDLLLLSIANENNLSETAFFVKRKDCFELRWFSPLTEVDLCGHATLAAAFVIFNKLKFNGEVINFKTKSGTLTVKRKNELLLMDFPKQTVVPSTSPPDALIKGLGATPKEVFSSIDYLAVFDNEYTIRDLSPDFGLLKTVPLRAVIVTAKSDSVDFVSRCFGPKIGINEDPVTGSTHCTLTPFWADRLKKNNLHAHQISKRGGELFCELYNERVLISGNAVLFMEGSINI